MCLQPIPHPHGATHHMLLLLLLAMNSATVNTLLFLLLSILSVLHAWFFESIKSLQLSPSFKDFVTIEPVRFVTDPGNFPLIFHLSFRCVSTTIDPFWDISLDLGNIDHSNGNGRSSSGASAASTPDPIPPGNNGYSQMEDKSNIKLLFPSLVLLYWGKCQSEKCMVTPNFLFEYQEHLLSSAFSA